MNRDNSTSLNNIDEFVEAYESAREDGLQAHFVDFLPNSDHDLYRPVAAEVIRVDMEYSWNGGQRMRLSQYQELVPDAFDDREVLRQVAFEEYRLRLRAGECVSSEEYKNRYGIDTDRWPRAIAPAKDDENSSAELMREALVLADNVQAFPAAGDAFLDFSLQREIGRGAFARVYLAQQGELADRLVVLKVASGHTLEPQHLARLQHTNIVPIYSVHRQEELTAVCMPYFGERTFADLLDTVRQKSGSIADEQNLISTFLNRRDPTQLMDSPAGSTNDTLPTDMDPSVPKALTDSNHVDVVVWLMQQVAEGISHAHERGIVHRDLKPANILLTDEGLPMVLDFNLSENVVVNGRTSLLVGGTLPYMAPEHLEAVLSGGNIGSETDIFSLGVIFYELLTGQRPFSERKYSPDRQGSFDEFVSEMIADRKSAYPSVRALNRAVPPSISAVVARCLAPDRKQRYGSAEELTDDLHRHLCHQPLAHAADRSTAERGKKWLHRHPRISSGGGVAAIAGIVLLLALGGLLLRGQRIDRLNAENLFQTFSQKQPSLYMALGAPHSEFQILEDSIVATNQSLESYGVLDDPDWRERNAYKSLSSATREKLDSHLGALLYLAARANEQLDNSAMDASDRAVILYESLEYNRLALEIICSRGLLLQRARLLEEQGLPGDADRLRFQATTLSAESVIDQYADVYALLDARNYRDAKPLLTALRDRNPTDPVPWLLLGDANAALGLFHESEGCLTTAIALRPDSYMGYYHRGRCRMDLKRYEDAQADFEYVIHLRPQLTCGFLNRALTRKALRNYEAAIVDLSRAIELGATQTRIFFLRSDLYRLTGDADRAKADFDKGMSLVPADELSWVARGFAQLDIDADAALADFEQALRINPVSQSALRNCVHVLADCLDRPQDAIQVANQLLALNENDTDALASRSVLYARQGDRPAAMKDLQQMLRTSRKPKTLFQAACTLSLTSGDMMADSRRALTLLARAVQAEPIWLYRARTDPDLENLRQTEGYQKLVAGSRKVKQLNMNLNKHTPPSSAATAE